MKRYLKFGARAELRNILQEEMRGAGVPVVDVIVESANKFFVVWAMRSLTTEFLSSTIREARCGAHRG